MKRADFEDIIKKQRIREMIDIIYRTKYKTAKRRREIQNSNKKTYTKKQILEIFYDIEFKDCWYLYWWKIEEDEPTTEQKTN